MMAASFPHLKSDVKVWIARKLGADENTSIKIIHAAIDDHSIDGKLLRLLPKYPHELLNVIPNLRARLLFLDAIEDLLGSQNTADPKSSKPPPPCNWENNCTDKNRQNAFSKCTESPNRQLICDNLQIGEENGSNFPSEKTNPSINGKTKCGIPYPPPLPKWDSKLQQAIKEGRLLDRIVRIRMIRTCARFYMSLNRYPTQDDYHNICFRLIQEYPDLQDPCETPGYPPYLRLKRMLSMSIRNMRRKQKGFNQSSLKHLLHSIHKRYWGHRQIQRSKMEAQNGFIEHPPTFSSVFLSNSVNWNFEPKKDPSIDALPEVNGHSDIDQETWNTNMIPNPAPLPPIDAVMEKAIIEGKLRERSWRARFMNICAEYYTSLKPYPHRNDYRNICSVLSKEYSELGTPEQIKQTLSMHIRNRRRFQKIRDNVSTGLADTAKRKVNSTLKTEFTGQNGEVSRLSDEEVLINTQENSGSTTVIYPFVTCEFLGSTDTETDSGQMPSEESNFNPVANHCDDIMIPDPPPLPPLSESLLEDIRKGFLQDRNCRNLLVRTCAKFYLSLKSFPTKTDYRNICKRLISEFPDLQDPNPLPGYPPYMILKRALSVCIRNMRVRNASHKYEHIKTEAVDGFSSGDIPWESSPIPLSIKSEDWEDDWNLHPNQEESADSELSLSSEESVSIADIKHSPNSVNQSNGYSQQENNQTIPEYQDAPSPSKMEGYISVPAPLPPLSRPLREAIQAGRLLENRNRSRFLHAAAEFYLDLKYYPSKEDYNNICFQLVEAYPQLADPNSPSGQLYYSILKKDLSMYVRNLRHRGKVERMQKLSMNESDAVQNSSKSIFFSEVPGEQFHQKERTLELKNIHQVINQIIPYPAPLPSLPLPVRIALEEGRPLEGKLRSRLLHACAEFYTDIKYYPSREDYNNICHTLVEAYPQLLDTNQGLHQFQVRKLKKDLSMYIRNLRHKEKREKMLSATSSPDTEEMKKGDGTESKDEINGVTEIDVKVFQLKELISELK